LNGYQSGDMRSSWFQPFDFILCIFHLRYSRCVQAQSFWQSVIIDVAFAITILFNQMLDLCLAEDHIICDERVFKHLLWNCIILCISRWLQTIELPVYVLPLILEFLSNPIDHVVSYKYYTIDITYLWGHYSCWKISCWFHPRILSWFASIDCNFLVIQVLMENLRYLDA
jgi:hypothetical protein